MVTIGLTYTGNDAKHDNYVRWLQADADIRVIRLQAPGDPGELTRCDALVLSGGLDMHPNYYQGNEQYPHMPPKGFDKQRDEYEIQLFEDALRLSIPVLGICRGMQLINVFLGGTLVQHIPVVADSHMGAPDKQHMIHIDRATVLFEIAGTPLAPANSAHHQCIDRIAPALQENCRSADGIIEGLEWSEKNRQPFMLAVQWHPERMKLFGLQDSPLSKNIRDRFIAEIHQNKQSDENH